MPHSPELIERMLKEAGLFDNVKSWFSGFFGPKPPKSKEQQKALSRVDAHFGAKDKDWDKFLSNANRKSFAKAIANDPRADDKLKMHVDNMNRLQTGKQVGSVAGSGTKTYRIIKLRGSDRLGCSCNDWRYKKSVAQPGEQIDCKHIRQFKQMNKTAASSLRSRIRVVKDSLPGKTGIYQVFLDKKQIGKVPVSPTSGGRVGIDMGAELSEKFRGMRIYPKVLGEILKQEGAVNSGGVLSGPAYSAWRRFAGNNPAAVTENVATVVRENPVSRQASKGRVFQASVPSTGEPVFSASLPEAWKTAAHPSYDAQMQALSPAEQRKLRAQEVRNEKKYGRKDFWKEAGHVEDRIAERAPGSTYEVAKIKAAIPMMKLRRGQTYHVPLKGGKGYVVIGDVGKKHVVKTVLGPSMRPPGERVKAARAPRNYKKEYNEYHSRPEQIANRSLRNQARRKLGLKNGDTREVDHKNPLSKGGSNGKGNLRAVSRTENRRKFDGT